MTEEIKAALSRSRDTLLADAAGAAALAILLVGGLGLPHLI